MAEKLKDNPPVFCDVSREHTVKQTLFFSYVIFTARSAKPLPGFWNGWMKRSLRTVFDSAFFGLLKSALSGFNALPEKKVYITCRFWVLESFLTHRIVFFFQLGGTNGTIYSLSHNHGSGKWLFLNGTWNWRQFQDPFSASTIMGGRVGWNSGRFCFGGDFHHRIAGPVRHLPGWFEFRALSRKFEAVWRCRPNTPLF